MNKTVGILAVLLCLTLLAAPGWAVQVFNADFQASTVADKTDQANVNAGTSVGSWSGLPDSATQAAWAQGMHVRQDAASSDKAVLFDRFESGPATGGNANLSEPIALDGAVIQMQLCLFRTGGTLHSPGVQSKDVYITGFDAAGNMSFRLVLSAPNVGGIPGPPDEGRRFAYFSGTTLTMFPQGQAGEMTGGGGGALQVANPTTFNGITITCTAAGWTLNHTTPATTGLSGGATAQTWTSGVIPYNGSATEIAYISFAGTASTATAESSGYWVDDLFVDGTPAGGGGGGAETVFTFPLSGSQGGVTSPYAGCGTATLSADQSTLTLVVEHNVPNPTLAHIHKAARGTPGSPVFTLDHTQNPITATWNLAQTDVDDLLAELLYVNIHTAANPGGEIRGQIVDTVCGITSNVYPPFIDAGTVVILTAPPGSDYQWKKGGVNIDGATNQVLVFDPVQESDQGDYTVVYNDGTKVIIETLPFKLIVSPDGSVPVVGLAGLAALLVACAAGGASAVRRRKQG